MHYLMALNQ